MTTAALQGSRASRRRPARPLLAAVALAAAIALNTTASLTDGLAIRPIDIFAIGLIGLAARELVVVGGRAPRLAVESILLALLPLLLFPFAALAFHDPPTQDELALRSLRYLFILTPLASLSLFRLRRATARKVATIVGLANAIGVVASIVLFARGWSGLDAHQTYVAESGARLTRLGGIVGESGAFGTYSYVGAVGLLVAGSRFVRPAIVGLASVLVLAVSYEMSLTRITIALAAVHIVGLARIVLETEGRTRTTMVGAGALVMIGVALLTEGNLVTTLLDGSLGSNGLDRLTASTGGTGRTLTSGRSDNWASLLPEILKSPLFGHGYRSSLHLEGVNTENLFVSAGYDFGLVGGLLFLGLLFRIGYRIWHRCASLGTVERIALRSMLLGLALQWQVNDIASYHQAFPLAILLLAPALVDDRPQRAGGRASRPEARPV